MPDNLIDFSGLLNDPTFQYGMTLLGAQRSQNPFLAAQQAMQGMQSAKSQQAYQQAMTEDAKRQADLRAQELTLAQQMGPAKLQMERMQIEQAARQQRLQEQLMGAISKRFGFTFSPTDIPGSMPATPQASAPEQPLGQVAPGVSTAPIDIGAPATSPQAAPAPTPNALPVGKYGTPAAILDNLRQTESSGNPLAINPTSGAMGAYQFMPQTIAMMRAQGHPFNPLDEKQSRDAADHYLQTLVATHGGDYQKALADYGGFKTKDPSQYIAKILGSGVGALSAPTTPPLPVGGMNAPQPNGGMDLAQLGALAEMAGLKGGSGMIELGKMQQPQNVAAGSYQREPSTGALTFIQDPYRQAQLGMENQRLGLEGQRNAREATKQTYEMGGAGTPSASGAPALPQKALDAINEHRFTQADTEIQKSFDANKELPNQIAALRRARADIEKTPFVGTTGAWKQQVIKSFTNAFGMQPDAGVVNAEDFDSAMAQLWMKAVKQVDQNPTENQMNSIKAAFGSRANDPGALKAILKTTEDIFVNNAQRHNRAVHQYESKMGPDPYSRYLDIPTGTPVAASDANRAPAPAAAPAQPQPQAAPRKPALPAGWSVQVH